MTTRTLPEESFRGLIHGVVTDLFRLVRDEIALARVEIREHATRARGAAVQLGFAIASVVIGTTFLGIALALGIAALMVWPAWAGFVIVGTLLCGAGTIAWTAGRRQLRTVRILPEETLRTLKETSTWMAKRFVSDRR